MGVDGVQDEPQTLMEEAQAAIGGFLWLGNNLHNAGSATFRHLYEVAIADAQPVYDRIEELLKRMKAEGTG